MPCRYRRSRLPRRRRKAKQRARDKGRTASQKTLSLSGWVLVITSLPAAVLDTPAVASL